MKDANESFMNEPERIVEDVNVARIPQPDEVVTLMQANGNGMKKHDEPQPLTSQPSTSQQLTSQLMKDLKED